MYFYYLEPVSKKKDAFNAALMCGMPFRQASYIGTEGFWDKNLNEDGS
jgi:hypothetical protein